ncbi:MAG: insulinase family protein [Eubacteriales bacterium]|nr:insulinase family protein [Eubacteriales bacterium]
MLKEKSFRNYTLEQHKKLDELHGEGYVLRHNKTGARVLLVENDDNNKVFHIGFRTPPCDDTGVAHILEHSVLCGSAKFPSKDPFVELVKGSLNTFLNAMTYSDKTVYPIASCNAQDYHNLMHVYLDAVFYPNIYKKDEILKQEGWHYEIDSPDGELKFNGVVYNEMKGVYSSPDSVLERKIQSALLKDTPYAYESGGDPDAIPALTREMFLDFHSRYYHPSNSYIYLYGNVDFEKELAFIDEEYLSHFDYKKIDSEIALQPPFAAPIVEKDTYSVSEGEEEGILLSYNALAGDNGNMEEMMALQILDYVLLSMPGAPVKKTLIEKGLGKDIDSYFDGGIQQPTFSIIAKNAPEGKEEEFIQTVEEALRKQVENGINKKAILSCINSFEFKYREADFGRYPKGLIYGLNFFNTWLYDDSKALELADSIPVLVNLKKKVEEGYFESLITKYFLNNTHKAYVYLYPEAGKNERLENELKAQLNMIKSTLSKKQIHLLIEDTKNLKIFQETPSTQEELEKIPMLDVKDISRKVLPFSNEELEIGGIPAVVHRYDTNGIAYFNFNYDMTELPEELIPYATLLVEIFRYVDTENYTYNDLATEINLKIGGISFSTGMTALLWKKDGYRPYFNVRMKCLEDQISDGMELMKEIMFRSHIEDTKRLAEILSELVTKMETKIPEAGHNYAVNRAMSYVQPMAKYKEIAEGISFFHFLKDLDKNFDAKKDMIVKQLWRAVYCIFRKENLTLSLTGTFQFKNLLQGRILDFVKLLHTTPCVKAVPVLFPNKDNEGFKTASKVQYVATAGYFEKEGQEYTGALRVLRMIFSYEYLWINIRVTGGAYGCMCNFSTTGYGYFTSYRDPNLAETMDVYKKAADYVRNFDVNDRDMQKYIIGTISGMDIPMGPAALGDRSFAAYQSGVTVEMIQKERDQILDTTQEDIRKLAPYIESMMGADTICTIGNEKKIVDASELFGSIRSLS